MENLLKETLEDLQRYGKTPTDVRWVGSRDGKHVSTWETFAALADREYYNGFGGVEVCQDLVIVGDDWWLARAEYDGSEWWAFRTLPTQQPDPKPVTVIFDDYDGVS